MEKKLKVAEFAALVGVMPTTIYRHMEKGIIKYERVRDGGRELSLIPESEKTKYLSK